MAGGDVLGGTGERSARQAVDELDEGGSRSFGFFRIQVAVALGEFEHYGLIERQFLEDFVADLGGVKIDVAAAAGVDEAEATVGRNGFDNAVLHGVSLMQKERRDKPWRATAVE